MLCIVTLMCFKLIIINIHKPAPLRISTIELKQFRSLHRTALFNLNNEIAFWRAIVASSTLDRLSSLAIKLSSSSSASYASSVSDPGHNPYSSSVLSRLITTVFFYVSLWTSTGNRSVPLTEEDMLFLSLSLIISDDISLLLKLN